VPSCLSSSCLGHDKGRAKATDSLCCGARNTCRPQLVLAASTASSGVLQVDLADLACSDRICGFGKLDLFGDRVAEMRGLSFGCDLRSFAAVCCTGKPRFYMDSGIENRLTVFLCVCVSLSTCRVCRRSTEESPMWM
jgi:hypothetical protein